MTVSQMVKLKNDMYNTMSDCMTVKDLYGDSMVPATDNIPDKTVIECIRQLPAPVKAIIDRINNNHIHFIRLVWFVMEYGQKDDEVLSFADILVMEFAYNLSQVAIKIMFDDIRKLKGISTDRELFTPKEQKSIWVFCDTVTDSFDKLYYQWEKLNEMHPGVFNV